MPQKIVIIGGSAAGPKVASKARRLEQEAEITIIQRGKYLSMSSCGYPYYVGGVFNNRNRLISAPTGGQRDSTFFSKIKNIKAIVNTEAKSIDRSAKLVENYMISKNMLIRTSAAVTGFTGEGGKLKGVNLDDRDRLDCDLAVMLLGSNPMPNWPEKPV